MSTSIEDNELPKAILTRIMKQVKSRKEGATKPSKDKDDSSTVPTSKKRKPTMEESNTNAKARKSSTGANPRDGQDITSGSLEEDIDEDEDAELEDKDEGDDDNEEDEDEDAEAVEENGTDSLNMDDEEHDDEEGKASNLDDEDDSDGF
ncbi:hypothetical protein BGZ58_010350 [Dissophora ornata]|nr:hypothetical protein BGZ58_010350 [Dissophora ornata]